MDTINFLFGGAIGAAVVGWVFFLFNKDGYGMLLEERLRRRDLTNNLWESVDAAMATMIGPKTMMSLNQIHYARSVLAKLDEPNVPFWSRVLFYIELPKIKSYIDRLEGVIVDRMKVLSGTTVTIYNFADNLNLKQIRIDRRQEFRSILWRATRLANEIASAYPNRKFSLVPPMTEEWVNEKIFDDLSNRKSTNESTWPVYKEDRRKKQ